MTTFSELGLSEPVRRAIAEMGFETPSPIQAQAIPALLSGDPDLIGLAQTGTGKTAAFGLPLVEKLDVDQPHIQALVLAPTRELGQQITQQLQAYSKYVGRLHTVAVYGGANIVTQIKQLKKPTQIVIATPGRLIDLIERKALKLDQIRYLILDEADEMLNMGFKEDLDHILKFTPENKRTWLFSATMSADIRRIVKTYMADPVEVKIEPDQRVNENIEHRYAIVKHSNKTEALSRFLDVHPDMRGIVFCRTRAETQHLADVLQKRQYRADALHGDLSQTQRDRVMNRFKSHSLQVLIATDVAARGIDVSDLTHVFHYSLPEDQAYYTHRSGRTARAGKTGMSVAFVSMHEKNRIDRLRKGLGIQFDKILIPSATEIESNRLLDWAQQILKQGGDNLDESLVSNISGAFSGLTKEQLIDKLIRYERKQYSDHSGADLNEQYSRGNHTDSRGGYRGGKGRHYRGNKGGSGKGKPNWKRKRPS